jgi:site-specific DNA-cytosine methylase
LEQTLKIQGYKIIHGVLDTADLGIPQNRKRFWVKATLDQIPSFPVPENWVGWYEAIADLIPNLPSSKLPASKKSALEKQLRHFPHVKGFIIQHTGGHQIKNPDEPVGLLRAQSSRIRREIIAVILQTCGCLMGQ